MPGAADSAALILFRLLEHPCQFETKRVRETAETIKISTKRITLGIKVKAWTSRLTRDKRCRNWFKQETNAEGKRKREGRRSAYLFPKHLRLVDVRNFHLFEYHRKKATFFSSDIYISVLSCAGKPTN